MGVGLTAVSRQVFTKPANTRPVNELSVSTPRSPSGSSSGSVAIFRATKVEVAITDRRKQAADLLEAQRERKSAIKTTAARYTLKGARDKRGNRPFANPYFWAAFQCVGAGW